MQELDKYLDVFSPLIDDLITKNSILEENSNVRIGGSLILKLYGLNFSRQCEDLDIIINNPSKKQKEYLEKIELEKVPISEKYEYTENNYKFTKSGLILNILVTNVFTNDTRIRYKFNNNYYKLNTIDEIIRAKISYGRPKDRSDLQLLKNENFNI